MGNYRTGDEVFGNWSPVPNTFSREQELLLFVRLVPALHSVSSIAGSTDRRVRVQSADPPHLG
jgi:hypothetical protein